MSFLTLTKSINNVRSHNNPGAKVQKTFNTFKISDIPKLHNNRKFPLWLSRDVCRVTAGDWG